MGNWGCTLHPWYKPPHCEQWETSSRVMTTRHRQLWSLGVLILKMDAFRILRRMDLWCSFQKRRLEKNRMFPHVEVVSSFEMKETHGLQIVFSPCFFLFHDTMEDKCLKLVLRTALSGLGQVILHSGALPSLLKLLSHAKKAGCIIQTDTNSFSFCWIQ